MGMRIALAGNPNSGKTTLFNALTGSAQTVGNWPGVTVEKKAGKLKRHPDVTIVDLPGIYSLSPYTLEEVIARDFLLQDKPDLIINIVDASNLERNLYLTTQIVELGVPTVVALNLMDIVAKRGDLIKADDLAQELGCPVVPLSAVQETGLGELISQILNPLQAPKPQLFSQSIEDALSQIAGITQASHPFSAYEPRWAAIKLLERDERLLQQVKLAGETEAKLEAVRRSLESALDDDVESIMTNERYLRVAALLQDAFVKQKRAMLSTSDKIDRVLTNRFLALPIFFLIMWGIYAVSIQTVGDWTIGWVEEILGLLAGGAEGLLTGWEASEWLISLILDGLIGGVGAVLVFVPQLMILYFFISLLEDFGYMARVAFIMDRIFRRFGLSGKSFIPMLIGTGCSVPAIMAARTIENENDRKMTIMLTPFIPCGAKLPVFALFVAMVFRDAAWVGPSMYLVGMIMVILSGVLLKRTRLFAGKPAPFVMELPEYKLPRLKGVALHMWEKGKAFVVKAGTVIFLACAVIWFLQSFDFSLQYIGSEQIDKSMLAGIGVFVAPLFAPLGFGNWAAGVAAITGLVAKEVVVSTFALISAGTVISFTAVSAYAFMIFTLLAAPCFAAIGAIRREMGGWKWTLMAVGYQTGLAYVLALLVNLAGSLIWPHAAMIQFGEEIEAAGEGAISSIALLENPLVYMLGVLVAGIAISALTNVFYSKKGGRKTSQPAPDAEAV